MVKYVSSDSPTLFLSGGDDKTLRLWDTRTASEARRGSGFRASCSRLRARLSTAPA